MQIFDSGISSQYGARCVSLYLSQGQNKPLPCSHNIPQQMDHLRLSKTLLPGPHISDPHITHTVSPTLFSSSTSSLSFSPTLSPSDLSIRLFPLFPSFLLPVAPSVWVFHRRAINRGSYIQMPSITKMQLRRIDFQGNHARRA